MEVGERRSVREGKDIVAPRPLAHNPAPAESLVGADDGRVGPALQGALPGSHGPLRRVARVLHPSYKKISTRLIASPSGDGILGTSR